MKAKTKKPALPYDISPDTCYIVITHRVMDAFKKSRLWEGDRERILRRVVVGMMTNNWVVPDSVQVYDPPQPRGVHSKHKGALLAEFRLRCRWEMEGGRVVDFGARLYSSAPTVESQRSLVLTDCEIMGVRA